MPAPATDRKLAPWLPYAAVATVALVAAWLRWRAVPGPWGSDALGYVERALGGADAPGADTRSQRAVFLAIVRTALAWGAERPAAASVPGVLLSTAVVPVLWLAARVRLGPWLALVPAAIWAVLGLDVEEVVEVSADAATALPGALAAWALVAARDAGERAWRPLLAAGLAAGAAFVLKETGAFLAAGVLVGAALTSPRGRWHVHVGAALAGVLTVVAATAAAGALQHVGVAADEMARARAPVRAGTPEFLPRVLLGVPRMLLTATGAFGVLHLAGLPLAARVGVRTLKGDPVCAAALAALVAFAVVPVSTSPWAVLPATFPRYVLGVLPLWIVALTETLDGAVAGRAERALALAAAVAALLFVGSWPPTWTLVPAGLALAAWVALSPPDARPAARGALGAVLVAAAACSLLTDFARRGPDPVWTAWPRLPAQGAVHVPRGPGRRLALAARTDPSGSAARLRLYDDVPPPAGDLAPGDVLVVPAGSAAAEEAARAPALRPLDVDLGVLRAFLCVE